MLASLISTNATDHSRRYELDPYKSRDGTQGRARLFMNVKNHSARGIGVLLNPCRLLR